MHLFVAVAVQVQHRAGAKRAAAVVAPAGARDGKPGGTGADRAGAAGHGVPGCGVERERVPLRVGARREAHAAAREHAGLLRGLQQYHCHVTTPAEQSQVSDQTTRPVSKALSRPGKDTSWGSGTGGTGTQGAGYIGATVGRCLDA